ncbi:hypothetical protein SELMODRAFT_115735 [Selaginella moellendorffii]|uniref:Mediator of RNA polymerase II transcription subunit 18 n=1 Tax=Selaginella moellendorffii TaxID=88036 RepID=D8SFR6_SELML|nr:hypothetical protein SELMODRAFT_115735 [Selaginella moellendorffii]
MECVVQGIIEAQHVEALDVLLQGLCEGQREAVKTHEICLKKSLETGTVASELHLLCDLSKRPQIWTVKHIGGAMRGTGAEQLPALVRNIVESKMSNNALRFFYAVGYKMDYELLRDGFAYRFQRAFPITVTVTSVCRLPKQHSIDEATPVTPNIQLVEVTAPATADNFSDVVPAISSFAEHLSPLVNLSKPGSFAGIVSTASTAAASLLSRSDRLEHRV